MRIQRQQAEGRDHQAEFAAWKHDETIRRVLEPQMEAMDAVMRRNGEMIESFRTVVTESLRELSRRMEQALRMLEQRVRLARQAVLASQPPAPTTPPNQPLRPDIPTPPTPTVQQSPGFRM